MLDPVSDLFLDQGSFCRLVPGSLLAWIGPVSFGWLGCFLMNRCGSFWMLLFFLSYFRLLAQSSRGDRCSQGLFLHYSWSVSIRSLTDILLHSARGDSLCWTLLSLPPWSDRPGAFRGWSLLQPPLNTSLKQVRISLLNLGTGKCSLDFERLHVHGVIWSLPV